MLQLGQAPILSPAVITAKRQYVFYFFLIYLNLKKLFFLTFLFYIEV